MEPMRWTPYMEECLRMLEEAEEYSTDKLLVHLIRSQLIRDRIASVQWTYTSLENVTGSIMLQDSYVDMFTLQVNELNRSTIERITSNRKPASLSFGLENSSFKTQGWYNYTNSTSW